MAEKEHVARRQSSSKRTRQQGNGRESEGNGHDTGIDEQELAGYLQDRIKPGLNRGSIPLLARSIAKEIARQEYRNGAAEDEEDEEPGAEADEEPRGEADEESDEDEESGELDDGPDLETALHELQAELGEDWILYFSVQGEDTWLTAEKDDATQRVEARSASVLTKAVKVLNEGGGRSGRR
jgi:hypothetical protein